MYRTPHRTVLVGPFLRSITQASCTACGRGLTLVAFLGRADRAVLCCDGCGRRGVSCECSAVPGYRGIGGTDG